MLLVAVLVQISIARRLPPLGGSADLVLVVPDRDRAPARLDLRRRRRLRRPGLLLDTANLGTLGFTSLLLTLAGFWIGRYGETTARDRFHAPFTSVAVDHRPLRVRRARARVRPRRAGAGRRRARRACRRPCS